MKNTFEINTGGLFQGNNNSSYQSLDNDNLNVLASPTPFSKELRLEIDSPTSSSATLFIMDLTGRVLLNRKVDLQKGYNDVWLRELEHFPTGVMSYRLSTSELSTSGKIIKH